MQQCDVVDVMIGDLLNNSNVSEACKISNALLYYSKELHIVIVSIYIYYCYYGEEGEKIFM